MTARSDDALSAERICTVMHQPEKGRFIVQLEGAEGVLRYTIEPAVIAGAGERMVIPSVIVDPAIGGRGVASALTRAAVEWAQRSGRDVVPVCPYVAAWLARNAPRPFVVPCRALPWHAPLGWLRRGWSDLCQAPGLSAVFGAVILLVSLGVAAMAWSLGRFALLAALLSGFVFIAPLIGVGLYCVSRALERGERPTLASSFVLARRVVGQAAVFALVQMVVLLLWSRAGMMVNAFVPVEDGSMASLIEFVAIGSAIGSVFAAVTFAIAAFSLPMIADRDVDMVTAGISSVNAVLRNKPAAITWAALIALLTAVGFATAFVGLAVIMPWLAYAAWHGYRETLDASAWPALD